MVAARAVPQGGEHLDYLIPMIGVGIVTSVHCVAMCGSLVLTYAVKDQPSSGWRSRMLPHLAYQSAKIVSYIAVGLLLGLLGSVLDFGGIRGWVTAGAGVFMILLGLNMTGRFPVLNRLTLRPPRFLKQALSRTRKKASAEAASGEVRIGTPLTFGLLTGLMPCGPLQAAQLAAAGAGSAYAGAMTMLGFGLGTAPLMLAFGTASGALSAKFKQRMLAVAALVIVVLGLVMLNRGALLLGSPVTAQTISEAVLGSGAATQEEFQRGADGVVEVPLVIRNTRFEPSTLQVPDGEPFRLVVDRQEANACSEELVVPQMGVRAVLAPNAVTVVEVPAMQGGRYTLTCGMGMMYGLIQAGGVASSSPARPLLAGTVILAAIGFALWKTRPTDARRAQRAEGATVATVLGLSPTETLVVLALLAAAAIAGAAFGGTLTY